MATLCAATAGGNLDVAATWVQSCTGASANQLQSKTGQTVNHLAIGYSASFTIPNGQIIDGVYLALNKFGGANGTFTITLSADNGTSATYSATFNVSDLPSSDAEMFCWKFASTITGTGVATYKLGLRTQNANVLTARRNTTSNDWFRVFRTTSAAAGAPAAGDNFIVAADIASAGATISSGMTVTWNDTAGTLFGSWSGMAMMIGRNGIVTFANAASTNYTMVLKGSLIIKALGKLRCGTVASPIPSTGTAEIQIQQNATDGQYNIECSNLSELTVQGVLHRTVTRAYLNASAAAGTASLTSDVATGWKAGDVIGIFPTRQTAAQYETKTLGVDASGTTITLPSNLSYLHDGVAGYQAELILLNRNVTLRGLSSTKRLALYFGASATVDIDYVGFRFMGANAAGTDANVQGAIYFDTNTDNGGSASVENCGEYDIYAESAMFASAASKGWFFRYNNIYSVTQGAGAFNISNPFTVFNFSSNWATGYSCTATIQGIGSTVQDNHFAGMNDTGISYQPLSGDNSTTLCTGNVLHSCGGKGLQVYMNTGAQNVPIGANTLWRNIVGVSVDGSNAFGHFGSSGLVFTGLNCYGNQYNGDHAKQGYARGVTFRNCVFDGGATVQSQYGFRFGNTFHVLNWLFDSCDFGVTNANSIADIFLPASDNTTDLRNIVFHNSRMFSTAELINNSFMRPDDWIGSQKHDQTAGLHKAWTKYGRLESDSTLFKSATPSEKLVPNNASNKLMNTGKKVSCKDGFDLDVSVWVRKSVIGDGTAYNGNHPRLIVKANPTAGYANDAVLATATAASVGAWEQLTASTAVVTGDSVLDLRIDCDGTAGWINVDDWEVS